MLRRYIKSNRGSTLVMVLLILTILSILGTALLSLSLMNLRMKKMDANIKNSFYWSETALDEAYAIACSIVQEAIEDSNTKASNDLSSIIASEKAAQEAAREIDPDTVVATAHLTKEGAIIDSAVEATLNNRFKVHFNTYIDPYLWGELGNFGVGSKYNIDKVKTTILISNITETDTDGDANTDEYRFTITTSYVENSITKTIQARLQLDVPDYNTPYFVSTNKGLVYDNILFSMPLIAEKNIVVTGNDVLVNGNVYAYGTRPLDLSNSRAFGGLVVGSGGTRGNITINGNVSSNSYVHTNTSNSSIDINGNVYANSVVIQDGVSNALIDITGNVYTEDDLELNGSRSTMRITGDFFGFSDGSGAAAGHYESSSIVFNSIDLGEEDPISGNLIGSQLIITGEAYLGGTVYINTRPIPYQSGESVAFKRSPNYLAYQYEYTQEYLDDLGLTGEELTKYQQYLSDKIEFVYYEPLLVADRFSITSAPLVVENKRDYIYLYNMKNSEVLLKGGTKGIVIGNVIYSIGTFVNQGTMRSEDALLAIKNEKEPEAREAFDINVKKMGQSSATTDVTISSRFTFPDSTIKQYDAGELAYISSSSDSLEILGPGLDNTLSNHFKLSNKKVKGLIITKGDVYLKGNIEFSGTIVTEGNIYIQDNEEKIINHDKYFIKRKIAELKLSEKFKNNISSVPEEIILDAGVSVGTGDDFYLPAENLIKIINWKKQ